MRSSILILKLLIILYFFIFALTGHSFAQTRVVDGNYLTEWLVIGPFLPNDLATDFLASIGGEATIQPKEGNSLTISKGIKLRWKRYRSRGNVIDLFDAVGNQENATAYAFCLLQSEVAGKAEIHLGRNTGVAVWINGKRVYNNAAALGVSLDEHVFEADLKSGLNPCLIKVTQATYSWSFMMWTTMLPPSRALISGVVTDENGKPIPEAEVRLERDASEIAQTKTDASGRYGINVYPVGGRYDLAATSGELGDWQLGFRLHEGDLLKLNLTLKKSISLEGILLMLDNMTPHVAVPVQAIGRRKAEGGIFRGRRAKGEGRNIESKDESVVMATTLSDEQGKYRLINLKPGRYQLRCQILGGYVYYGSSAPLLSPRQRGDKDALEQGDKNSLPVDGEGRGGDVETLRATSLRVQPSKTLSNIDFRFAPIKKGNWRNYTYLDGLVSNSVDAIYRDSDGVMWFGTYGGVSKYDGKRFVNFTTKDGLANNWVDSIHQDPDGVMWFGTNGGVSKYDGKRFVNFTTEDGLAHNIVRSIHRDSNGVIWFGTHGGVSKYDGKRFVNFTTKDGLANNSVDSIHQDPDGVMWFGTSGGISRYDGKKFVNFTTKDGLAHNDGNAIYSDPDGVVWFGTESGVSRYDGNGFVNFTTKDGLVNNWVSAIYRDSDGVMWFGSWAGGVSRYDGKRFVNFTPGLPGNSVNAIHQDPDGIMWFGTDSGIFRYDEKEFVNFTTKDGLVNNRIRAINQNPDGVMWFGTDEGLSKYDGKGFVNFTTEDGLVNNGVGAIHRDPDGVMWFGTKHPAVHGIGVGGVSKYDGKEFVNFTTEDGLAHNSVLSIYGDADGMIWFGTEGGVSRYDGKKFVNFTTKDGLAANFVRAIHQDRDGIMWFGTWQGQGVSRYDGKGFVNFTTEDGLVNNSVGAIYQDQDGVIWFGTSGGISKYDGKKFVNFTTKDGLAGDNVIAIHQGPDGVMWFGTADGGVSRYDGLTWTSLDTRDGLANDHVRYILQDSAGFLWFGTVEGVTRYRQSGALPPTARIVSIRTDQLYTLDTQSQREVSRQEIPSITVGARVTVEYNSIDFKTVPEKRQYRIRLIKGHNVGATHASPLQNDNRQGNVNSEDGWEKPTKSTTFDWVPKKAGSYSFEVQAIDRDLNYSKPARLTLKVVLPFYLRAAFLVPTLGLGALLLVTITVLSISLVKRRRQVLAYQRAAVEELQDARQMQMSLLPQKPPTLESIEIAGKCISANTVGGDFFDYLHLPSINKNQIGIIIGDVTGKGLKGAMNAVMVDGILHMAMKGKEKLSPASLLMEINDILKDRMERDMNVTMVIGLINAETKTLTIANAGHHMYPIILRNGQLQFLRAKGLPLGVKAGIKYGEEQFALEERSIVIFMTDGIIEARDMEDKLYLESRRLEKTISQFGGDISAEGMVEAIINDAIDFGGEKTTRDDDMTVVVAKMQ